MRRARWPVLTLLTLVLLLVVSAVVRAQTQTASSFGEWAAANWIPIGLFVLHLGASWHELIDHRRRLTKLETFTESTLPATYARKDLYEREVKAVHRRISELDADLRG